MQEKSEINYCGRVFHISAWHTFAEQDLVLYDVTIDHVRTLSSVLLETVYVYLDQHVEIADTVENIPCLGTIGGYHYRVMRRIKDLEEGDWCICWPYMLADDHGFQVERYDLFYLDTCVVRGKSLFETIQHLCIHLLEDETVTNQETGKRSTYTLFHQMLQAQERVRRDKRLRESA